MIKSRRSNMKNYVCLFLTLLFVACSFLLAQKKEPQAEKDLIAMAKELVHLLEKREFSKAVINFDSTMTKLSPPEKLKEVWELITKQAGQMKRQVGVRTESIPMYDIIYVTCEFEKATLDIKIVFNKEKQIAGQFFVPTKPPVEYKPPAYADPESFIEKDISVGSGEWKVPGTLTLPK